MNFPDQYHAAAVWQQHILDESKQRRLAELVARRQRRRQRSWTLRGLLARAFRWRRSTTSTASAVRTRPAGCTV
ncbi:MAG: hypothetical protein ACRDO7_13725 [Nocardioidaceae bacterium]